MHQLSLQYGGGVNFVNTASDFSNYNEPVNRAVGISQEVVVNLENHLTKTIHFEQLVIKTYDGLFSRKMTEKRVMQFTRTSYRSKKRSITDTFITVEIEVSDDILLVERVYPNIIELFSEIGGILKTLTFLCISIGILHNQILFNKHSLDSIELPEDIYLSDAKECDRVITTNIGLSSKFTYWETFRCMFGLMSKSDRRKKAFESRRMVLAEKLDISRVVG
jgi:hypothetical protein